MPFSVLMTVEGVLTDDTFDFPGAPPLPAGLLLFHGLASVFTVHLSAATHHEEAARRFLIYGCGIKPTQWGSLWLANEGEYVDDVRTRHLTSAQANNYDIRYFVTPDPRMARLAIKRGITPLCCPHPAYSRPSFLPHAGSGRVEWDEIEAEVMNGRLLHRGDPRLREDDEASLAEDDEGDLVP